MQLWEDIFIILSLLFLWKIRITQIDRCCEVAIRDRWEIKVRLFLKIEGSVWMLFLLTVHKSTPASQDMWVFVWQNRQEFTVWRQTDAWLWIWGFLWLCPSRAEHRFQCPPLLNKLSWFVPENWIQSLLQRKLFQRTVCSREFERIKINTIGNELKMPGKY